MRCRVGLHELIPLLVHLVLERSRLRLWWQTHKLCQADCKQKTALVTHAVGTKTRLSKGLMWASAGHLPNCDGCIAAPVGVIDYSVEGLIDPLPEHDGWSRPADRKGLSYCPKKCLSRAEHRESCHVLIEAAVKETCCCFS